MCVAVDKELIVAGFLNQQADNASFTIDDIMEYVRMLWNAGCGPIRLNFSRQDLADFLARCYPIVTTLPDSYQMNSDAIEVSSDDIDTYGKYNAKSFSLFDKLNARRNTPDSLLDAMGYYFLHTCQQ